MRRKRKRRPHHAGRRPELTIAQILAWADFYHERTGKWPRTKSRFVYNAVGEKWSGIDRALRRGYGGLPGKSSLAQLLAERRGVRNKQRLPPFQEDVILRWADGYFERQNRWPRKDSGSIPEAPGEKWSHVDAALHFGNRGLAGKSSLAQLLAERRGRRHMKRLPPLRERAILAWADAYYRRYKKWPKRGSGAIPEAPGETWAFVDTALWHGHRGLVRKSSLAQLLAEGRGVRHKGRLPPFTMKKILAWADAFHRTHNKWPKNNSGPIAEAPGETWGAVESALHYGLRGLPKGSSLARALEIHRGVRNQNHLPRLTYSKILAWADAVYRRTGKWPTKISGANEEAPGETWSGVNSALQHGLRGLPGDSSLARLLDRYRDVPNRKNLPRLTYDQILRWADAHYRRTGQWPRVLSGSIPEAPPGQTWNGVESALARGLRALPGGSSLARLLNDRRGVRNIHRLAKFTPQQILAWADRFHRKSESWPGARSGPIPGASGETWMNVENALRLGLRGLPKGSSLFRFLQDHGRIPKTRRRQ